MVLGILPGQEGTQVLLDQDLARFPVNGGAVDVGVAFVAKKLNYCTFQLFLIEFHQLSNM